MMAAAAHFAPLPELFAGGTTGLIVLAGPSHHESARITAIEGERAGLSAALVDRSQSRSDPGTTSTLLLRLGVPDHVLVAFGEQASVGVSAAVELDLPLVLAFPSGLLDMGTFACAERHKLVIATKEQDTMANALAQAAIGYCAVRHLPEDERHDRARIESTTLAAEAIVAFAIAVSGRGGAADDDH
jgi:hypothetical protein